MPEREYLCLGCGNYYRTVPGQSSEAGDTKCPKCGGTEVMKVSASRLFDFFSGGG